MAMISVDERRRIEAAIRDAESRTVGELVPAIAAEADDYRLVPLIYATAIALALPLALGLVGALEQFLPLYLVQLGALVVLVPLLCWRTVAMQLVPAAMKREAAA